MIQPHKRSTGQQQNFDDVITKCYNKNACGTKITVWAGDIKQEVYNWWPNYKLAIRYCTNHTTTKLSATLNKLPVYAYVA